MLYLERRPYSSIQFEGLNIGIPSTIVKVGENKYDIDSIVGDILTLKNSNVVILPNKKYNYDTLFQMEKIRSMIWFLRNYNEGLTFELEVFGIKNALTGWDFANIDLITFVCYDKLPQNFEKYIEMENVLFKFMVSDRKDYLNFRKVIEANGFDAGKVFFAPAGESLDEIEKTSELLVRWCINDKFMFCPRIQTVFFKKWGII